MKLKFALLTVACFSMSACATVDMTSMAGQTNGTKSTAVQTNVVQRAAKKLYAAFVTKGWAAKSSRKRVQSTANVLLKGLEPQTKAQQSGEYSNTVPSYTVLAADIRAADQYVSQTVKAAEVYLSISEGDVNMRSELSSLEKALIAARQAEIVFDSALVRLNRADDADFESFKTQVNMLREITDQYGDRVRGITTRVSAANFS